MAMDRGAEMKPYYEDTKTAYMMAAPMVRSTQCGIGIFPVSQRATVVRWTPSNAERPDCVSPASVRSATRVSGVTRTLLALPFVGAHQNGSRKDLPRCRHSLSSGRLVSGPPHALRPRPSWLKLATNLLPFRALSPARIDTRDVRVDRYPFTRIPSASLLDVARAAARCSGVAAFQSLIIWRIVSRISMSVISCSPCLGKPSVARRYTQCNNLYHHSPQILEPRNVSRRKCWRWYDHLH